LGDVGENAVGEGPSPLHVRSERPVVEPDPGAVLALDPVLDLELPVVFEQGAIGLLHAVDVLRVDAAEPEIGIPADLLRRETVHPVRCGGAGPLAPPAIRGPGGRGGYGPGAGVFPPRSFSAPPPPAGAAGPARAGCRPAP